MAVKITKWSPDTCGCVIDYTSDGSHFLTTKVCPDHQHLATKTFRQDHQQRSDKTMQLLEEVLQSNLDNSPVSHHWQILRHNEEVRSTYEMILTQPHVFDSHIHEIALEENQRKNQVLQHAADSHPKKLGFILASRQGINSYKWEFSDKAPNRILNISFPQVSLTDEEKKIIESKFPNKVKCK